ncbi:hypothetical protein ACFXDH_00720 [Streptomyces sp. NPDC059467]|uniref:hypothetical protein n=1 Tax=Streptomyces sp. NPDC059467 TaxID=3346844 RepID=UPI00368E7BAB
MAFSGLASSDTNEQTEPSPSSLHGEVDLPSFARTCQEMRVFAGMSFGIVQYWLCPDVRVMVV